GHRACALPLAHVVETMRPLAFEPMPGSPDFVRGVSVIRGVPTPVVDLKALWTRGEPSSGFTRFVTLKVGGRQVALAVDGVEGVRRLEADRTQALPPLLGDVEAGVVDTLGALDDQLLIVLRAARLVPEEVWAGLSPPPERRAEPR